MEIKTSITRLTSENYKQYFEKGISYQAYLQNMENEVASKIETNYSQYVPMNLQRSKRIAKTLQLQELRKTVIKSLTKKVNWLLISEHWCGDASQILPVINAVAEFSNGMIDLRVVYRDENPELIEAHLTNGTKSIPKLIQLDENFVITAIGEPRPEEAQKLVKQLKSNPETANNYSEILHKWYADDKTISTQKDLIELLNKSKF